MKLYTRGGDAGETALVGGTRVSKADPRVDAYGEVDELSAWLGLFARTALKERSATRSPTFSAISLPLEPSLRTPVGKSFHPREGRARR